MSFEDIENHWAKESIDMLVRLNVIKGYADGSFKPDQSITRAEFASMLVRVFNLSVTVAVQLQFSDADRRGAKNDIEILIRREIVKGYTDLTIRPNETISREEIAVLLVRMINLTQLSVTDGTFNGYADQTIMTKGDATRAETAAILLKLLMLDPRIKQVLEQ